MAQEAAIRILLAAHPTLFREALTSAVADGKGIEVVATASDGHTALAEYLRTRPDVSLLEWFLPRLNGCDAARAILAADPDGKILLLSEPGSEEAVSVALAIGARGYLQKSGTLADLHRAVVAVSRGGLHVAAALYRHEPSGQAGTRGKLTVREAQIVQLIAEGRSAKEVANVLGVSPRTVQRHRDDVSRKFGVPNLQQLTRFAIREGLIRP